MNRYFFAAVLGTGVLLASAGASLAAPPSGRASSGHAVPAHAAPAQHAAPAHHGSPAQHTHSGYNHSPSHYYSPSHNHYYGHSGFYGGISLYPSYYSPYYSSNYSPYYAPSYYTPPASIYAEPRVLNYYTPDVPAAPSAPSVSLASAEIEVRVPADAELWLDGNPTRQRGAVRTFVSPLLQPGRNFTYEVRARWMQDGKPVEQTREIEVWAGAKPVVDFRQP